MKLRDKLKSEEYFNTFIEEELDDISFYKEQLSSNDLKKERIIPIKKQIAFKKIDIFYSKYSMGEDILSMQVEMKNTIGYFCQFWNSNTGYVQMVWMLSIVIMLEVEDKEFNKLVDLVKKDNPNDYLIDFLINYRNNLWEKENTTFMFEKPYKSLSEVIDLSQTDKVKAVELLKQYLDKKWYKGHSDMGWYDSHKESMLLYSGYWAWEVGAIVKILGLDDNILKNQKYYPYDMVHWKY